MNTPTVENARPDRYIILAAIMLGGIMGPIDASIVNVTLPTIAQYFGAGLSAAQWVPTIYLLIISSLLLFYGRLGDVFGYKKIYLAGLGGFTIASALCGLSYFLPGIAWLVGFRAIQAVTAGMMMAVPFAMITAVFPPNERGKALGINAISISAGLAIGPSLGGFINSALGWPFVFYVNIPIGVACFFWARPLLPDFKGQRGRVDFGGAALSFVTLASFILFVNDAQHKGLTVVNVIFLTIAAAAAAAFVRVEKKADPPMLDFRIFRNRTFSFANLAALFNYMSQYIMVFLTPFLLQRVLHDPPGRLGLTMTAFPLAVMAVAPFSGSLSDRIGTRALATFGTSLAAVGLFLMSRLPAAATNIDVVWRLAFFGLGTGLFQSPNNSRAMGSAPRAQLGVASGILATTRNVGMIFGIATAGAVLYGLVSPALLRPAMLSGDEAARFVYGLRQAYLVGAILASLAAVTSFIGHGNAKSDKSR
jgi:EmrB/QacA subfamily drug resistance transporter